MLRFLNDFNKADKSRNMEFTLQFFLTIDVLLTAFIYYSTVTPGMPKEEIYDLTYLAWMVMLTISVFMMNCISVINFAKLLIVYHILHFFMIAAAFYFFSAVVIPSFYVLYFSFELGYLAHGLLNQKMEWPGKWIAEFIDKWQKVEDNQPDDAARSKFPFTKVAHEVVRKNCTIDEEFADDLFDYHTAYEDDLLPYIFHPKSRSTFIV